MRRAAPVAAAALVWLLLVLPDHPDALALRALAVFPLELPVMLLTLAALPGAGGIRRAGRLAVTALLLTGVLLKLADLGMFAAFNRPFNLVMDLPLVVAGGRLAAGAVGLVPFAAAGVVAVVGAGVLVAAVWRATGVWAGRAQSRPVRRAAAAGALMAAGIVLADAGQGLAGWRLPLDPPGAAATTRVTAARVQALRATLTDLRQFRLAAQNDPFAAKTGLFNALAGRDMTILFIESYGRTSFQTPAYEATHLATLNAAQARLAAAGLAMRSGWLTSPITGGQSWLAHATLASGLRIDNQRRYAALLASPRRWLYHLAQASGFATLAVMPAITLPWPEAAGMGFDTVAPAAALGYRGKPFNWVTMPDQFTLAAFERLRAAEPAPLFAQVVLISSHAPWVPVPRMIAWDAVGDGTAFDAMAGAGDPPEVVWRDRDRVRDQYRQAVDYSLQAVFGHVLRAAGGDAPLIVVLGDHQPARFVAQGDSADVPVHVIGPPDLIARLDGWGWTAGLVPAAAAPVWPMEAFRDRFIAAFSGL